MVVKLTYEQVFGQTQNFINSITLFLLHYYISKIMKLQIEVWNFEFTKVKLGLNAKNVIMFLAFFFICNFSKLITKSINALKLKMKQA